MPSILADTCVLIWLLEDPAKLSPAAVAALSGIDHSFLLSAASLIEIAALRSRGRIRIDLPAARRMLAAMQFKELPITGATAERLAVLPRHHLDPFDRMLIAEAQLQSALLLSPDEKLRLYDVQTLW
jgi:PIN domain nuclease of toxin-antitoxin system